MNNTIPYKGIYYTVMGTVKTPSGICYRAVNIKSKQYPKQSIMKYSDGNIRQMF